MVTNFFNLTLKSSKIDLNPPVPDNLICAGSRMHQIGVFRCLRSDRARLRDLRMSWIVSKGRASIFLSESGAGKSVKLHVLSQFKTISAMIFTNFTIFLL